jgi:hypothetical protein
MQLPFDKLQMNLGFEVFTAVTTKNTVFWDRLVRTNVSDERFAPIFRVEKLRKLGIVLSDY